RAVGLWLWVGTRRGTPGHNIYRLRRAVRVAYREDKIMAVSRTFDTARLCRNIALYGLGLVILFVWVEPIAWDVIVSFKLTSVVLAYPPQLIFDSTLSY